MSEKINNMAESIKLAMRKTCNAVYIVSTGGDGRDKNAITITSFTLVSLEPPSVLFCVHKDSGFVNNIIENNLFCVGFLSAQLKEVAEDCSSGDLGKKFSSSKWTYQHGIPTLHSANALFICKKINMINSGTHIIIIGEIVKSINNDFSSPLLYHNRQYKTLDNLLNA